MSNRQTNQPIEIEIDESDPADEIPIEIIIDDADLRSAADDFAERWERNLIVIHASDLSEEKHSSFYDKIRLEIQKWADKNDHKFVEYILLAPDIFMLLIRLTSDDRVPKHLRILLGTAIAYFISPIDAIPEAVFGPIGYIDDVVLSALAILKVLKEVDPAIVRQHWSGTQDIVQVVNNIWAMGESLVGSRLLDTLSRKIN